jgi:hypothetical protein
MVSNIKENMMYRVLVDNFVEATSLTLEGAKAMSESLLDDLGYGIDVRVEFVGDSYDD